MESFRFYRVYCSKCNKDVKRKMSWKKYLKYMSFDGHSEGYHNIPIELTNKVPTKCPFGHPIKENLTVMITYSNK